MFNHEIAHSIDYNYIKNVFDKDVSAELSTVGLNKTLVNKVKGEDADLDKILDLSSDFNEGLKSYKEEELFTDEISDLLSEQTQKIDLVKEKLNQKMQEELTEVSWNNRMRYSLSTQP